MPQLTSYFQKLWLKFRRRSFQYSLKAIKNPKWFLMFVFSRFQLVRSIGIFFSKYPSNKNYGEDYSLFEELSIDTVVESLKRDGLHLGISLPTDIFQEILEFAKHTWYIGNKDPQFCFSLTEKEKEEMRYGKPLIVGHHFNPSLLCPAIKKIENDPKLWEIAAKYLLAEPVLVDSLIWWSFVTEGAISEERAKFAQGLLHYDLEDYRCVKFYFYLTDVDLSNGPHVCVKGSHEKKKLKYQFSLVRDRPDKDIIDYYGIENVVTICGRAGFGFAEDPFCFHRGNIPVHKNRLILGIKFAISNYGMIW